jgi:hypothetical protein
LCHPGLASEFGGLGGAVLGAEFDCGLAAGSCANATTDAASKLTATQ